MRERSRRIRAAESAWMSSPSNRIVPDVSSSSRRMQRVSVVFTLLLTWGMNRQLEVINTRLVLSVLVSVSGAVLVVAAGS